MRVSDRQRYNSLGSNLANSLDAFNAVQQQLSTGKRISALSDDPGGGAQALALRAALVDNAQYQRNVGSASAFLSASESAINSVSTLVTTAHSIAIQGANGTLNQDSRDALVAQVDGIIRQVTQLANSDLHGKFLFGGTQTGTPPYTAPNPLPASGDPTPTYDGGTGNVTATVGKNNTITLNTPGSTVFAGTFAALQTLRNDLKSGTQAALSTDIDTVNAQIGVLSSGQADAGAKLTEIQSVQTNLTKAQGDLQDADSAIEDIDLSQAYVQLQSTQNTYQAALAATSRAFQLSLTDYLK